MEDFFKTGKWTGTGWMQTHKITNAGDARLVLSLEAQILTTFTASSFENVEGLPQRTGVGGVATDIVAASSCSHRKGSRSMSSTAATTSRRGLGSREASKKKRRVESDALDGASSASSTSTELPLGRYLASPDKRTRDKAIQSLRGFLTQRSGRDALPQGEMAKLWKGIFYCFWMSDKPRVQQALAQELADLVLSIPNLDPAEDSGEEQKELSGAAQLRCAPALAFLEGFWDAMIREWSALDKWRMDKFYLLLRRFMNAGLRLVEREGWHAASVVELARIMRKPGGCLDTNNVQVPDSIAYHLADIYLDELERALTPSEESSAAEALTSDRQATPLVHLLQPFIDTMATTHNATVYTRLFENVIQPLLTDCLLLDAADAESASTASTEAEELGHPRIVETSVNAASKADAGEQLRSEIFQALFRTASLPSANGARRARIYRLWEEERARVEE